MYEYKARLIKVIDGDTVDLDVDLGFDVHVAPMRVRLMGINTPEKNSKDPEERVAAVLAAKTLEVLLSDKELVIRTQKDGKEKYGRYLARLFAGQLCVNDEMVQRKLAAVYDGNGPMPLWPW